SEYVATHWQGRAYMSGFTGSAGTLVITLDESGLFTDGRYFIQAENELKGSEVKLFKMAQPGVPTINEYLVSVLN
ncbi:aminopeptidase P family protein, partial [Acinetobacter baumannii]